MLAGLAEPACLASRRTTDDLTSMTQNIMFPPNQQNQEA
jgi:hypothetical protein